MSEKKYKVSILNKDGSPKTAMMNYIESHYSTTVLLDPQKLPKKGSVLKVQYWELSDYLTTGKIENVVCSCSGNYVVITTEKTIYTFERLKPSKLELTMRLQQLCEDNDYFTGGSNDQYNKFFELAKRDVPADVLATIVYVCSPEQRIEDIESLTEEIEDLLYD